MTSENKWNEWRDTILYTGAKIYGPWGIMYGEKDRRRTPYRSGYPIVICFDSRAEYEQTCDILKDQFGTPAFMWFKWDSRGRNYLRCNYSGAKWAHIRGRNSRYAVFLREWSQVRIALMSYFLAEAA